MGYKNILYWAGTFVAVSQLISCSHVAEQASSDPDSPAAVLAQKTPRKVYRNSVIPGGVYSAEELARSRRIDKVVALHYADFGQSVRVTQLTKDELVYVSYRKADKVYWTKTKHKVCKGESVVTDGNNLARARCGNRLSETPHLPTAKTEPTQSALNTPEVPPALHTGGPLDVGNAAAPGVDAAVPGPAVTGANTLPSPTPVPTGASKGWPGLNWTPSFSPVYNVGSLASPGLLSPGPGGGGTTGGGTTSGGGTTTGGGGTITAAVPEPAFLLALGCLLIALKGLSFRARAE